MDFPLSSSAPERRSLRRAYRRKLQVSASFIKAVGSKISLTGSRCEHASHPRPPSLASKASTRTSGRHQSSRYLDPSERTCLERLPPELLAHIIKIGSHDHHVLPYTSSQVCRAWRYVLLHTPTAWTSIYLDYRIAMWQCFLSRSKGVPLDIYLHEPPPGCRSSNWDHNLVRWILQPALPHIYRWRAFRAEMHTPAPFLWNSILSPLCGDSQVAAPMLEELALVYPSNEDGKQFALFGGYAPNLRTITLNSVRLACPSIFHHLNDLRYTHMRTTDVHSVWDLLSTLQACVVLQHLHVVFDVRHRNLAPFLVHHDRSCHVHHVHLRHLQISILGQDVPAEMELFLRHAEFPNITILHCAHTPISGARLFSNVIRHVPRLGPLRYLKELKVEHGWVDRRFISTIATKATRLVRVSVLMHDQTPICMFVPGHVDRSQHWLERAEILWP